MSNVNLILSTAIAAARGDHAAQAAGIAEGVFRAFAQQALHGQSTPFSNGMAAASAWKSALGQSVQSIILSYWQEAKSIHSSKAKPTAAELDAVESRIGGDVMAAYAAEDARRTTAKAVAKEKAAAKKLASEETSRLASLASLDATVQAGDLEAARQGRAQAVRSLDAAETRIAALESGIRAALAANTKAEILAALTRLAVPAA